ncbi:MAG TPA: type II secretion system protein [Tepidisphaeraceae bacterium]|nr:type II secretion system protein [Tepidisphaeraceae bacterium]
MNRTKSAFTLVELLVVIGIIGVLIAILLPTLSTANARAKRTVCLSNLRELGMAMRLYATQNKDQIPIGYMDQHNFSYFANWNNANGTKISMMGLLAVNKLVPAPKTFYCPVSFNEDYMFDTKSNPWPPFENWPDHPNFQSPGRGHTRVSYNMRPVANWPTNVRPWATTPDKPGYWLPYLGTNWSATATTKLVIGMPRLSKLKNKAIMSDLIIDRSFPLGTHKTGINVLYANGSGQFVNLTRHLKPNSPDIVWRAWYAIPPAGGGLTPFDTGYNDRFLREPDFHGSPGQPSGVWIKLDQASQ